MTLATVDGFSWLALAGSLVEIAAAFFIVFFAPWLGKRRTDRLLRELARDPSARARFYRRASIGLWIFTGVVAAALAVRGRTWMLHAGAPRLDEWRAAILLASSIGFALGVRRTLKHPEVIARAIARLPERARAILPRTAAERRHWALVALSAGVCEELLYRGFITALFASQVPGQPWIAWLASTAAFGLAHVYQGWRAVLGTALLGALFMSFTVLTDSIWPAVALHALFDLRLLLFPDSALDQSRSAV